MTHGAMPSLDTILKAHAARSPDALALIDPPDCERSTGEAPRRLTWAQSDRAIAAIAARLREIGLAPGTVVGIQMPNTAASILALLGVMRAGMIAAPLPLLWRRADCVTALSEAGARAIVTCGQVAGFDHAQLALEIAAELFPIRAVCAFGCGAVDGIVPFDDLLGEADEHPDAILFQEDATAAFAVVTFDTMADGIVPVARDTMQILAGGRLVRQRGKIAAGATILSTIPMSSFAGISAVLVPWLLSGGTLVLHHPFDPDILRDQIEAGDCSVLIVPDALLSSLSEAGWLDPSPVRTVVSVWRAPERLSSAAPWTKSNIALVDIAAFGETALLAARRPADGMAAPWPLGPLSIAEHGEPYAHVAQTAAGTVGVRGALAAAIYKPYERDADSTGDASAEGHLIDTGYPCRLTGDGGLVVTAAPAGLIGVGGYRFAIRDLQRMVRDLDPHGVLAALPHARCGYRLAGHAADPGALREMLDTMGSNPLLAAAFRDRAA